MNWFSINVIIGLCLILFGLSIFLKELLGVSIPLLRLAFAVFLIYMGISLISNIRTNDQQTLFFSQQIRKPYSVKPSSYQTVFGDSTIDLTQLSYEKSPTTLNISTMFGNTVIYIDSSIPTRITARTSFGEVRMPDNSAGTFGTTSYSSHAEKPELILMIATTFGKTTILQK